MTRVVKAKDLQRGDILKATLQNEVFTIRQVFHGLNAMGQPEVTIRGPLGIVLKMGPERMVGVLNG